MKKGLLSIFLIFVLTGNAQMDYHYHSQKTAYNNYPLSKTETTLSIKESERLIVINMYRDGTITPNDKDRVLTTEKSYYMCKSVSMNNKQGKEYFIREEIDLSETETEIVESRIVIFDSMLYYFNRYHIEQFTKTPAQFSKDLNALVHKRLNPEEKKIVSQIDFKMKSIEAFEYYIINNEKPNFNDVTTKYDEKDIRFIFWNLPKIKYYEYSAQVMDKLGYDLISSISDDKILYRNCSKSTLVELREWEGQLSITLTWIGKSLRNQTSMMFCAQKISIEDQFLSEVQAILHEGKVIEDEKKTDSNELVYTVVNEPAGFPNGVEALKNYIKANLRLPKQIVNGTVKGTSYITFIIEKDGTISNVEVLRKLENCSECDIEAERIVKSMPKWKPGKQNEEIVRVQFNLPVNFGLENKVNSKNK